MRNKIKSKYINITLILSILAFFVWIIIGMFSSVSQSQVNYYKDDKNYEEIICEVRENDYGIYFTTQDAHYNNAGFGCWGNNADIVNKNNFKDEVQVGKQINITTAPRIFWDGYVHPIVALKTEDKVYLDFETGKQNQIETLQSMRKDYLNKSVPVISISIICFLSFISMVIYNNRIYRLQIKNIES